MKNIFLIIAFIFICVTVSFGQDTTHVIQLKKVFGGYQYSQNGNFLNVNGLKNAVKSNEQAYGLMKKASVTNSIAFSVSFAGGMLIGFPLGTALAGGDPNWIVAGVGVVLVGVSIPISNKFNEQAKEAVGIYNNSLQSSSFRHRSEMNFAVTNNGVGFVLKF